MGNVKVSTDIDAPVDVVFGYVDDYRNTTKYMRDLVRWEPVDGNTHGKGATFEVGMQAGPKVLESVVEMTAWTENKTIGWVSREGFTQKGHWLFTPRGNKTHATFELDYDLGGGIAGKVVAKVTEPFVKMNIEKSVETLKRNTEKLAAKALKGRAGTRKPAATKV